MYSPVRISEARPVSLGLQHVPQVTEERGRLAPIAGDVVDQFAQDGQVREHRPLYSIKTMLDVQILESLWTS